MSASKFHRILAPALAAAIGITTSIGAAGRAASAPATAPATTSAAALPPATADMEPNKPIAIINKKAINNEAFYGLLMQVAGMKLFQQVFDLMLVQDACEVASIPYVIGPVDKDGKPTTDAGKNFQKRMQEEIQHIKDQAAFGLSSTEQEKVVNQLIAQRGLTALEFQMALERSAGLRELCRRANAVPDPTADEVKEAHQSMYGEQWRVWIFNVDKNDPGNKLATELAVVDPNPGKAAEKLGLPTPNGLQIPASTKDPAFKDILDQIKNVKPKDVSNQISIKDNSANPPKTLLLRVWVQEKIASTEKENPLDKPLPNSDPKDKLTLKDKIAADLREARTQQWMNAKLDSFRRTAEVTINDKVLSEQFAAAFKAMQPATKPATSTAPATATAPAGRP